jgi:hypothetical protein
VDYVIVTTDSLAAAFQPLADWKTQSGVPAAIRTLGFIRAEYPVAVDDAERIRLFLRDAYTRWGTTWVLLGGDTEVLPSRRVSHVLLGDETPPSDLYFSCLDGNWNADGDSAFGEGFKGAGSPGDGADLLPDVWVGRAPVVTTLDAQRFVQKTLAYEKTPIADYMPDVLFFAQVITPSHWSPEQPVQFDGAELVEQDMLPILDTAPAMHVTRLYQNDLDPAWRPGAYHESRASVIDSLRRGYNLAVHVGHGYREVMSCGDENLTPNDVGALGNGDRVMNLYAIDCTSAAIDYASIGEAMIRAPGGGAVTNIGSTTLDYPEFGRVYQKEYFRLLFQDSVTAVGEAQGRQKLPFVGQSWYDGFDRLSQLTLLLLGDPELRLYTATPRELAVTAAETLAAGDSSLAVHVETGGLPLAGARVTAWIAGHEYRSALTTATGDVTLPVRPDSAGLGTLTVTAFNARPWQRPLAVTEGAPAALQAMAPVVVDDAGDGRAGNGDGVLDAGEIADVLVPVRNSGGSGAAGVTGTLSTSDGLVTVLAAGAPYGALAPGQTVPPAVGFRVLVPFACPDQREVSFTLDLVGDDGLHQVRRVALVVHAPELVQASHVEAEEVGNGDGQPQPGETVTWTFRFRNSGSAGATGLHGVLRNLDGRASVLDSAFTVPDLPPGAEGAASVVRFSPLLAGARLALELDDLAGVRLTQVLDLVVPPAVTGLAASGGPGEVRLTWAHGTAADLGGYNLYRSPGPTGPYVRVRPLVAGRSSVLADDGLAPLTRYWYEVTAVDSSGNESTPSAPVSAWTNPPVHAGFPAYLRETSDTPVAVDHLVAGQPLSIVTGGTLVHLFHPDGTRPVDADGLPATPGDLSTLGRSFPGGASLSNLDGGSTRRIVAAAWDSRELLAFDTQGQPLPGFPVSVADPMWSSVAVGDLDGDGHKEMVFAGLSHAVYAFRSDGTEWRDGDANPATTGVFHLVGGGFNVGTPALADLEGTGHKDIICGASDGWLYAWRPDGGDVPGFPVDLGAAVNGSPAVGRLDGPGGPLSIVVPAADNSIRAVLATGAPRAGFPLYVPTTGTNHSSSPAIADMNGDGYPDIVFASTNGRLIVCDRNGALLAPWTAARFSTLNAEAAQASPVVADIDGDGWNDVVVGDESGNLAALSGADAAMLPGFPIHLDAEASGTAALCDCDGDGRTEIVEADYGGTLHVWDYDRPFSPGGPPPWPQFQHDPERTGCAETPLLVGVEPPSAAAPRSLELATPRPNPARVAVSLAYGIPAAQAGAALELAVYDLAGRRVRTLARGTAQAGWGVAAWDLRDDRGLVAAPGVYLVRMRAGAAALSRKVVAVP